MSQGQQLALQSPSRAAARSTLGGALLAGAVVVAGAVAMYAPAELSLGDITASLWPILFMDGFVLIALEGAFFLRNPEIHRVSQFVLAFLATGLLALAAGALASSGTDTFTVVERTQALLERDSLRGWGLRLGGAAGLFTLAYVTFGSATWPLVKDYYSDPRNELGLRVPDGRVVIALQLTRGLVTSLSVLPLVAIVPASGAGFWLRLSFLLAAVLALGPLALAARWPAKLRILHAVEITLFAFAYAAVVAWLLAFPEGTS